MDVTVSGSSVFVTGEFGSDMPVMKLNSDGDLQWSRTIQKFGRTEGREVVVYESPSAAASIYVGCQSLSESSEWHTFVAKLSESPDGEDASLEWMLDVSQYSWVTGLAVGVEDDSVYVGQTNRLAKISAREKPFGPDRSHRRIISLLTTSLSTVMWFMRRVASQSRPISM